MTTVNMTSIGSPVLLKRRLAKKRRPLDGVDNYLPLLHLTYNTTATLFQTVASNRGVASPGFPEEAQNSKLPNPG